MGNIDHVSRQQLSPFTDDVFIVDKIKPRLEIVSHARLCMFFNKVSR